MKKFFLFLTSFIVFSSFSLLFAPNAFAEDISFTRVFDQYTDTTINYSNFSNGTCYIFRIGRINADGSRTWQPNAQGSSPQSCWREAETFYASEALGEQGTLTLPTSSLNYGDYELELNKRICQQPGNWGCISYNLKKDQFTIQLFQPSCSVSVAPPTGIQGLTTFSLLASGNFLNEENQVTMRLIDIDTGSQENTVETLTTGSAGKTLGITIPADTAGNYKYQIFTRSTPTGPDDDVMCGESNPFTITVNSAVPTPTPIACSPPDSTGQCPDVQCHLTSPGTCEQYNLALPTAAPTPLLPTPTPFPTIPAFNPVNCNGNAQCQACVVNQEKPEGVWTGVGCIKTDPSGFVRSLFGIILGLSGGIALILIIYSGYKMVMSRGNPETLQGARETLTAAIVGLLFIVFSFVILEVIGVDILQLPGFSH